MNLKMFLVIYNEIQYSLPFLLMWGIKFYTHTEWQAKVYFCTLPLCF